MKKLKRYISSNIMREELVRSTLGELEKDLTIVQQAELISIKYNYSLHETYDLILVISILTELNNYSPEIYIKERIKYVSHDLKISEEVIENELNKISTDLYHQ